MSLDFGFMIFFMNQFPTDRPFSVLSVHAFCIFSKFFWLMVEYTPIINRTNLGAIYTSIIFYLMPILRCRQDDIYCTVLLPQPLFASEKLNAGVVCTVDQYADSVVDTGGPFYD